MTDRPPPPFDDGRSRRRLASDDVTPARGSRRSDSPDDQWDDEWDEDWDEDESSADDARTSLVDGIRGAMDDLNQAPAEAAENLPDWSEDEEFGRKTAARSRLSGGVEDTEDRILAKTNSEMTNIMSSRRRSA